MKPLESMDPEYLGPYRLVARLGAGGMGRVFLARSSGGRTVAVKAIRPELAGDTRFRRRFRREVDAAGAVRGPYTAPVVDADPDAPTPWLATAYVLGPTLAEAVDDHGPLPVGAALALGAGLAEALITVHSAGLVHRDLKPSNVLLAADGPRVIDFGIARAVDGHELTLPGNLVGSPGYMCPEQATGDPMGPEGDVFTLGSVLAFAATGHPPFSASSAAITLYQVVHGTPDLTGLPEPLDQIVGLCLVKDPGARPTPDRLSSLCAPGGAERVLRDGWLPAPVASEIARHAAAVMDLDIPARERVTVSAGTRRAAHAAGRGRAGAVFTQRGTDAPSAGTSRGVAVEDPVTESPGTAGPDTSPGVPSSASWKSRFSRRTVLTAAVSAVTVAAGGSAALLLANRNDQASGSAARPLGPAPTPLWTYSGGVLLQAPAVFNDGTVLLKARPGNLICLALKDGTRPKWTYQGISQSPTPPLLSDDAVVALGVGATVVGVDPASGVERFTLDFGPKFQFQTLIGSSGGGTVTIEGLQVQQESGEQTAATSTSVVLEADLHTRVATVMPISDTDANVSLSAVLTPSYAIYADGLHNVTARKSDGSVLWSYQVGPDLRHGPAVLGSTVFAIGRELIALDLRTGKVRWQARGDSGGFSALGVGDGTVFCAGSSSGVYAFDAADGSRRWFRDTPRLNTDNPIVSSAKTVFVPAFENKDGFYALGAAQGEVLWHFTDGRDTGINGWQLSCDSAGHLVAQHYDRTYCLPVR